MVDRVYPRHRPLARPDSPTHGPRVSLAFRVRAEGLFSIREGHSELAVNDGIFGIAEAGDRSCRHDVDTAVLDEVVTDVDADYLADDDGVGAVGRGWQHHRLQVSTLEMNRRFGNPRR